METDEKFIEVGKLGRARGLKGEIYITPTTDFPERFLDLKAIYVNDRGTWQSRKIDSARLVSGRPAIKLAGINNPEDAAELTNRMLAIKESQLIELPDGVHYVFELIGCVAFEEETGRRLGEVVNVERYPANDVYVIKTDDNREILCPAVVDYVKEIDIENKKIILKVDGLPGVDEAEN